MVTASAFAEQTPLGVAWSLGDIDAEVTALIRSERVSLPLSDRAVQDAAATLRRDAALMRAGRRWMPGHAEPEVFVPGDIAAIRWNLCTYLATVSQALDDVERLYPKLRNLLLSTDLQIGYLLLDLIHAVPYFLPTDMALGVLGSRPPDQPMLEELRLPFERVLVLFGADLKLDPNLHLWPAGRSANWQAEAILTGLACGRGYVTGMVLLADGEGHPREDLLWLVAVDVDAETDADPTSSPASELPSSGVRIRTALRGWRGAADLAPLIDNVAASVAWGAWAQPQPVPDLPDDPGTRQWRKTVKRGQFRRRERAGGAVGVHVLDVKQTLSRAQHARQATLEHGERRASPVTHLRRGHWRNLWVGSRTSDTRHQEPRWIPPVVVQGSEPAAERIVVRRLPAPSTSRSARLPSSPTPSRSTPDVGSPPVAGPTASFVLPKTPPVPEPLGRQAPDGLERRGELGIDLP